MADEPKTAAPQTLQPAADKPQPDPALQKVTEAPKSDDVIERWFRDHFAGSAIADTTDRYNAAYAAKEDLKKRLAR